MDIFSPNFIYPFILTRSSLGLLCVFFAPSWLLIYTKISFPFKILRTNGQNFIKFYICIHIDKIYLGIAIIFCTFLPELWPLIYSKIPFLLNILRTNGQILTKLYITTYTDKICVGIVSCHFSHNYTSVVALDLLQKFVSAQYLENKKTDFDQTLYSYLY